MRRILFSIVSALVATTSIVGVAAARPVPVRHERWTPEPLRRPQPVRRPVSLVGQKIDIQWGGSWWPGVITAQSGGQFLVHYDGWSSSWDEWVDSSRIRGSFPIAQTEPELQTVYWNYGR